ncbi:MAG: hypothetical protein V5786_07230 [Psychromonas sp.]
MQHYQMTVLLGSITLISKHIYSMLFSIVHILHVSKCIVLSLFSTLLFACVSTAPIDAEPSIIPANAQQTYQVISERRLQADGFNKGIDTYQLIRDFAGQKSLEAPDLYDNNHPGLAHIYEASDDIVGEHFVFTIHKNQDKDRDVSSIKDRQRNEIKGYSGSSEDLKAYKNEMFSYSWKFKLNKNITVSKNFGHFFQLKAVDGGPGAPILTLSGRNKNGQWLEVIHRIHGKTTFLKRIPLEPLKGKWLQSTLFVNYSNNGQLELLLTDIVNNEVVLHLSLDNIDMLRGEGGRDFVRPKWGIYRSLRSKEMLRDAEEKVFFADFIVQKLEVSPAITIPKN